MARPTDSKIERRLRQVTEKIVQKGEDVTVKAVRSAVQEDLGLEEDFFKQDDWKEKSRSIIRAAVDDYEAHDEDDPATTSNASHPSHTPSKPSVPEAKANLEVTGEEGSDIHDIVEQDSERSGSEPEQEHSLRVTNGVKRRASEDGDVDADNSAQRAESKEEAQRRRRKKVRLSAHEPERHDSRQTELASQQPLGSTQSAGAASKAIPSKAYRPPVGFTAVDEHSLSSGSQFAQADLTSKQVWHITAPSNVPVSSLQDLSLDAIRSQASVLSYKGVDYILNEVKNQLDDHTTLLLPMANGYERHAQAPERRLELQKKVTLPNISARQTSQLTGSSAAGDIAKAAVSSVRPQPKGLRMRFIPPGPDVGKPGRIGSESDSEEEEAHPATKQSFQFPRAIGGLETAGAGQRAAGDLGAHATQKQARKTREKKQSSSETNGTASVTKRPARQVSEAEDVEMSGASLLNGMTPNNTVKKDKAKQKEERRREKDTRRKSEDESADALSNVVSPQHLYADEPMSDAALVPELDDLETNPTVDTQSTNLIAPTDAAPRTLIKPSKAERRRDTSPTKNTKPRLVGPEFAIDQGKPIIHRRSSPNSEASNEGLPNGVLPTSPPVRDLEMADIEPFSPTTPKRATPSSKSKEDKAKRKEERRLKRERKEAKRKAKESIAEAV